MFDSKKILVVDDESSVVELCRIVLESSGFEVWGVNSGKQALNLLNEEMPDLVLLDVMMPGMNGIQVCRKIRNTTAGQRLFIVMYTADNSDNTRKKSFEAGANEFVSKEIPIYDLPGKLKGFLEPKNI